VAIVVVGLLAPSCAKKAEHDSLASQYAERVPDLEAAWRLRELPSIGTRRVDDRGRRDDLVGVFMAPGEPDQACRFLTDLSWECVAGERLVADDYDFARELASRKDAQWSSRGSKRALEAARAAWSDLENDKGALIRYDSKHYWHGCLRLLERPGPPKGRLCLDVVVGAASRSAASASAPSLRNAAIDLLYQAVKLYREAGLVGLCRFSVGQLMDMGDNSVSDAHCEPH
jgi:hypothetical protein